MNDKENVFLLQCVCGCCSPLLQLIRTYNYYFILKVKHKSANLNIYKEIHFIPGKQNCWRNAEAIRTFQWKSQHLDCPQTQTVKF